MPLMALMLTPLMASIRSLQIRLKRKQKVVRVLNPLYPSRLILLDTDPRMIMVLWVKPIVENINLVIFNEVNEKVVIGHVFYRFLVKSFFTFCRQW